MSQLNDALFLIHGLLTKTTKMKLPYIYFVNATVSSWPTSHCTFRKEWRIYLQVVAYIVATHNITLQLLLASVYVDLPVVQSYTNDAA